MGNPPNVCDARCIGDEAIPDDVVPIDTHPGTNDLWISPAPRAITRQIARGTSHATIHHAQSGTSELDPDNNSIDDSHFGDEIDLLNPRNPSLVPNRVIEEPQGDPSAKLDVVMESEILCDGGRDQIQLDERGEVTLPVVDVLTGRAFITGKSGSGKSNTASVVVEELLDRGFPVLIVDTDGEYWGLKESYEILHVGADEECDLRVGPEHAEKIAEVALERNVPTILDVSGFIYSAEGAELVRETASALFAKEKKLNKPFLILIEECHEYLPQAGGLDETGEVLIRIAKRGRKRGLGLCGISQRPADVRKDFITQCDWLVWHRLTWENDTVVARSVIGSEYDDRIQDLEDGEAYLMADFLDTDVTHVRVRRKRTFDAGATPDLDEFDRPDLKSIGSDLVDELATISDREERRRDRIERLEQQIEALESTNAGLEAELESARDMRDLARQMAEGLKASGGNGDVAGETVEELVDERNRLRAAIDDRDQRINALEVRVEELEATLASRPAIGERALEAVEVLADEFDIASDDVTALRRKLKRARERIETLESGDRSRWELESDPLENRKVQSVVRDVRARLAELDDKEQQMLRYYALNGPASMESAYKYAGGSPTSGMKSTKTRALREAGLVKKVGERQYELGLRDHLEEWLNGFALEEIDCVYEHLEEDVYETIMEDEKHD